MLNRAFGGFAAPAISSTSSLNLANNELFDSRMYFSQTTGGMSLRTSARLSYTFTGDYFFTKRSDPRLIGSAGYRASAAVEYRLDGRTSITGEYQHMNFVFRRAYGNSDIDGGGLAFARQVTRNLTLSFMGGLMRVRTAGTQEVQLSEEVAAILGRTRGVATFNRVDLVPQINATGTYAWERSRFTTQFVLAVVPGNGVVLTSQMRAASAGYSFTGIRRLSLGASTRYMDMGTLSISNLRNQRMISGGGGINYTLTRMLSLSTQFDYRRFTTGGIAGRQGYFVGVGLAVAPTGVPLSIW
jgi:hypothetical protein